MTALRDRVRGYLAGEADNADELIHLLDTHLEELERDDWKGKASAWSDKNLELAARIAALEEALRTVRQLWGVTGRVENVDQEDARRLLAYVDGVLNGPAGAASSVVTRRPIESGGAVVSGGAAKPVTVSVDPVFGSTTEGVEGE